MVNPYHPHGQESETLVPQMYRIGCCFCILFGAEASDSGGLRGRGCRCQLLNPQLPITNHQLAIIYI